jgi:hypothetical protein
LRDAYGIALSADSLARYIRHYQILLAARQEDPAALRRQYQAVEEIMLSIDGLQPEKGHETLYVVRDLTQKRVWFVEPLLSATAAEVRRLLARAKEWALALGKPVALWLSDRQGAFVTGSAAEFPDVPPRYCVNHFLRDVAKPVLEAESHAKVQMRKKGRAFWLACLSAKASGNRCATISTWSAGFACPRVTSVGSTVTATQISRDERGVACQCNARDQEIGGPARSGEKTSPLRTRDCAHR